MLHYRNRLQIFVQIAGLFSVICFFTSCLIQGVSTSSLSSMVHVRANESGEGDSVRFREIYIHPGTTTAQACRPAPFDHSEARRALKSEGTVPIADEFLNQFFQTGQTGQQGEQTQQEQATQTGSDQDPAITDTVTQSLPVNIDPGTNWLKIGLTIANHNTGEGSSFFLIIDTINYNATATCQGQKIVHAGGNIGSSYCGSPGFLYFIPPGTKVTYEPNNIKEPLKNLTLFLSGFPVADRSGQLSFTQRRRFSSQTGQSDGNTNTAGGQQATQPSETAGDTTGQGGGVGNVDSCAPQKTIVIPRYRVELTLRGNFVSGDGQMGPTFVKRTVFYTQAESY